MDRRCAGVDRKHLGQHGKRDAEEAEHQSEFLLNADSFSSMTTEAATAVINGCNPAMMPEIAAGTPCPIAHQTAPR